MRKRDIQFCLESLSFFMGAGRVTEEVEARIARMDRILWEELEAVLVPEAKEEAVQEQEPALEPAPETKPDVVQTKSDDVPTKPAPVAEPKQEQQLVETWLAKDKPECKKCQYSTSCGTDLICDYISKTGKARGCSIAECEHWKDKRTNRRQYKHTCISCGCEFVDYAPRTKLCSECKEAK